MLIDILSIIVALIALLFILTFLINKRLAAKGYHGPVSDHFDGKKFISYGPVPRKDPPQGQSRSVFRWMLRRPKNSWTWRENPQDPKPQERIEGGDIVATFVNHATMLIQTEGLNILTDPVWSKRISPFSFIGPQRYRKPGIAFDNLPTIDVVLLSHNHYDHMDIKFLQRIAERWNPKFIVSLGNAEYLAAHGVPGSHEMDWGDSTPINNSVSVHAVPAQHFSSRGLSDRNTTLWCGYVITTPHGDIYFAGDTGYGPFVKKIAARWKKFRLAFLPIGAFKPEWFMSQVHVSPDEAFQIHQDLSIETSIGIHFGTFRLSDESQDEPPQRIRELVKNMPAGEIDFRTIENGDSVRLAQH